VEFDSASGELSYGNLIDVFDVSQNESTLANTKEGKGIIEEFILAGNSLKKQQIQVLIQKNNFELIAQDYKNDPVLAKRKIKEMQIIGCVTYKALVEFLAIKDA
jgi:hypothetical protein